MITPSGAWTRERLLKILKKLELQPQVGKTFPEGVLAYADQMVQLREFVDFADEYSVAYECIVCLLETSPFTLTGKSAVALLEIGLLLGYKTDRPEDEVFDRR